MSTVVKDLGAVSAYAYAVEKGYTGTEAEFAELMADYAEVGQRAEDAAESALNSKTAAQTAATTATNKASEATTAAQTATTKAGEAQTSAQTASTKASEASQSASQALSYKTDAESAKTASQTAQGLAESARDGAITAKTAAETAQGAAEDAQAAAEDAAESVSASAAQIDTNTADISDIKEDLNAMNTASASDVGKALKAKIVTNGKVTEWEFGEAGGSGSGLTVEIKTALLQIAQKVTYIDDDGQNYYDDLYDALYPPATLVSISAVYTQSGTVYDTDMLDSLKSDLVVTGTYSDTTTRTITDYTLSGTLSEGTSTITASYSDKTTTFTVVVTHEISTDIPVYYTDVSIKGNAPGTSDGSVKETSVYPTNATSAVFDAEAASYRVVDDGTHDRFRFYGITEELDVETPSDFASITVYRIADSSTVSGIDALSEYVIDNSVTQYKIIFVYLASSKTGNSPDLTVTRIS